MLNIPASLNKRSRFLVWFSACFTVIFVGVIDFLTGYEILFTVFYLLAIIPATWFGGRTLGFLLSILSVVVWTLGDFAAGASHLHILPFFIWWNAFIQIVFYFILVVLVDKLHHSKGKLEQQVLERTQALVDEMEKGKRLEKEILSISEREQRRIGNDLHDTLCQHLTGTALAAKVLQERLAAKVMPEADEADLVTSLIEEGIGMTRDLARGLSPVDMQDEGLVTALLSFADGIDRRYGIYCRFESDGDIPAFDVDKAVHLYRIVQEAVTNAIKHGEAGEIRIRLSREQGCTLLTICDNGKGLPQDFRSGRGMGIRIMEHRASMIGATFHSDREVAGGTKIVCSILDEKSPETQTDSRFQLIEQTL